MHVASAHDPAFATRLGLAQTEQAGNIRWVHMHFDRSTGGVITTNTADIFDLTDTVTELAL